MARFWTGFGPAVGLITVCLAVAAWLGLSAGLAGASVFHGIEGFGKSERIHTSRILSLADEVAIWMQILEPQR